MGLAAAMELAARGPAAGLLPEVACFWCAVSSLRWALGGGGGGKLALCALAFVSALALPRPSVLSAICGSASASGSPLN